MIGENLTSIRMNDVINISGNITEEDSEVAFGMVAHNQSGAMVNTTYEGSGSRFNFSQAITITQTRGEVVNFTVFYNTTSGEYYQASSKFTIVNTAPTQPNMFNTSGLEFDVNQTFNITPSTDADGDTLTYFWFLNSTLDPVPNPVLSGITETSWTTNLTLTDNYYIFVNVSDGFVNVTGNIFNFFMHIESPTIISTGINNSAPKLNEDVQVHINITDDVSLKSCWYANNISTFINISSINFTATQTELNYSVNVTNILTRGNVVKNVFTCNDTFGHAHQTEDILWTVSNTKPPSPSISAG